MTKTIVLVRHGKAQLRSAEINDELRELTEAGVRALKRWLPRAARLLKEEKPASVEIWTSPAVRARQTADLVADEFGRALGAKKVKQREMPCLWEQDLFGFFAAVKACDADVVVAVGHNPFMEIAIDRVCNQAIVLATGAVAAVRIDATGEGGGPLKGRLLWLVQGPEAKRWKALTDIEAVIAEATDDVVARRKAFFDDPDDVEAAHKYRVSIRTIRGLLAFVKPFLRRRSYKRLQSEWRSLVVPTSRLREYDVLAMEVAQLERDEQPGQPGQDDAERSEWNRGVETLSASLQAARAKERDAVLKELKSKRARACFERVCKASRHLEWKRQLNEKGLAPKAVSKRFDQLVDEIRADLATLDLADAERTHDVRKRAKQVRYAAERFEDLVGADARAVAKSMKGEQDRLGALCDARVNIDIIDAYPTKALPDEALLVLRSFRAQNEQFIADSL